MTPAADSQHSDNCAPEKPEPRLLTAPTDGIPPAVDSARALAAAARSLAAGHGPIAVDAERASGFRYSARAYLVQLRRAGSGTFLIDPLPFASLRPIQDVIGAEEWVLHAADQDLACLAEVGLHPAKLFDTELAARLLGLERVGLAAVCGELLGLTLAKEHSAADWSTRPLPQDWLNYAALDVELLLELRAVMSAQLEDTGKAHWAAAEFDYLRSLPAPRRPRDPWRTIPGAGKVRTSRQLAVLRELWLERDQLAAESDTAPGRILRNADLVATAVSGAHNRRELLGLPAMRHGRARRHIDIWAGALRRAYSFPEGELPDFRPRGEDLPQPRSWTRHHPEAFQRLEVIRAAVRRVGTDAGIPPENVLAPRVQRRLAWHGTSRMKTKEISELLARYGARPWQVELVLSPLARALR